MRLILVIVKVPLAAVSPFTPPIVTWLLLASSEMAAALVVIVLVPVWELGAVGLLGPVVAPRRTGPVRMMPASMSSMGCVTPLASVLERPRKSPTRTSCHWAPPAWAGVIQVSQKVTTKDDPVDRPTKTLPLAA